LLQAVKKAHPDKAWSITALPSWLNASDAKQLFTTADGVVIQLNSLKLPDKPEMPVILCDPIAARETVRQMSKLGIPYHIALNTYSCEVWFDANAMNVFRKSPMNPFLKRTLLTLSSASSSPPLAVPFSPTAFYLFHKRPYASEGPALWMKSLPLIAPVAVA
jgi:hypothetical protein